MATAWIRAVSITTTGTLRNSAPSAAHAVVAAQIGGLCPDLRPITSDICYLKLSLGITGMRPGQSYN